MNKRASKRPIEAIPLSPLICASVNGKMGKETTNRSLSLFSSGLFMGRGLGELHWLVLAEAGAGLLAAVAIFDGLAHLLRHAGPVVGPYRQLSCSGDAGVSLM